MYKYIETEYTIKVEDGFIKNKRLEADTFTYKERNLTPISKNRAYGWEDTNTYTWETLPDTTEISKKYNVYYKSRALFYELDLTDRSEGDIWHIIKLKQKDCPNATFNITKRDRVLSEGEYTLKEVFDKAPAYQVIAFLREHSLNNISSFIVNDQK